VSRSLSSRLCKIPIDLSWHPTFPSEHLEQARRPAAFLYVLPSPLTPIFIGIFVLYPSLSPPGKLLKIMDPEPKDTPLSVGLGEAESASSETLIDEISKEYDFVRHLGDGSFATVWLVRRKSDGLSFAAKLPLPRTDPFQLWREACCLATGRHFAVVGLVAEIGAANSRALILEYADSGTLSQYIRRRRDELCQNCELPSAEGTTTSTRDPRLLPNAADSDFVARCLFQLCLALNHVHSRQIVHHDVKPANVFLDSHGLIQLGDFGLSCMVPAPGYPLEASEHFCGTFAYAAPEVLKQQRYNNKADMWSLGVTLYYLLALRRPFGWESPPTSTAEDPLAAEKQLYVEIVHADFHVPYEINHPLVRIAYRLLDPTPRRRPSALNILSTRFMREVVAPSFLRSLDSSGIGRSRRDEIIASIRQTYSGVSTCMRLNMPLGTCIDERQFEILQPHDTDPTSRVWKPSAILLLRDKLIVTLLRNPSHVAVLRVHSDQAESSLTAEPNRPESNNRVTGADEERERLFDPRRRLPVTLDLIKEILLFRNQPRKVWVILNTGRKLTLLASPDTPDVRGWAEALKLRSDRYFVEVGGDPCTLRVEVDEPVA
jgi:serine/threonine protein kinase